LNNPAGRAGWRASSHKAYAELAEYIQYLNSNRALYTALAQTLAEAECTGNASEEELIVARQLKDDMERNGVHLDVAKRAEFAAVQAELVDLNGAFMQNIYQAKSTLELPVAKLSALPLGVRRLARVLPGGASAQIPADRATASEVLKQANDADVRRGMYAAYHSGVAANLEVLDRVLGCRRTLARLMGHTSYADYVAKSMMAGSCAAIDVFLRELLEQAHPKAVTELAQLDRLKKQLEGDGAGAVEPWDRAFYMGIAKAQAHDLDSRLLSEHFSVENCMAGLHVLVSGLFGMTFEPCAAAPGELWHVDVEKYVLRHPEEGVLGHVYLDLHPRPEKYDHFAQFSVQCGFQRTKQTPLVALVCNFTRPEQAAGAPTLLSHSELETLLHEFGAPGARRAQARCPHAGGSATG
jgi:Zn-dependent oligopeptidase